MTKPVRPINMRDATLPLTYEDALQEIVRLKNKLEKTNEKWAAAVQRRVLDNKSHGRKTKAQKELNAAVIELCDSGYDGAFMGVRVQRLMRARWGIE